MDRQMLITSKRDINVDQNVEACFKLARSHLNGLGFKICNALDKNPNPKPSKLEVFTYIFYKVFMDHNCESSIKIRSRIICYILECFAQTDFIGALCPFCVETLVPIPASQPMKILIALKRPAV
jgi:hypothetical protein